MSLKKDTVHIPLAQGPDQKSDPRSLEAPKLSVLQNGAFEEVGGIQKRGGTSLVALTKMSSGTVARRRAIRTRDDELVLFAEGRCWSRSVTDSEWMDRGRYESVLVDQQKVAHDRTDQVHGDRAQYGGVALYAWDDRVASGVRYECIDIDTGAVYESVSECLIAAAGTPICRAVNGQLHLYYAIAVNTIKVIVIDPADVYGTLAGGGSFNQKTISAVADTPFDVCVRGTQSIVVHTNVSGPVTYDAHRVGADGTVATSRTDAFVSDSAIGCSYDASNNRVSVVRVEQGATDDLKHDLLDGTTLANATHTAAAVVSEVLDGIDNVTSAILTSGVTYVVWDLAGTVTPRDDMVMRVTVQSNGTVGTIKVLMRHCQLGSRAALWTDGSTERALVHVLHDSPMQPAYFLLDADVVVGQTNGTRAAGEEVGLLARVLYTEAQDGTYLHEYLPQIENIGSNQLVALLGDRRHLPSTSGKVYSERGLVDVTYTFADARAFRGVQEGRTTYMPGGYLAQYDGLRVVESGFLLFPEAATLTPAGGGGGGSMTAASAYSYHFYWERINGQGERQLSSYEGAVSVTAAQMGANTSITVNVPCLSATNDDNIILAGFRTKANPGPDAAYYRVTSRDPTAGSFVKNDPNSSTHLCTFTDTESDTNLEDNELDYQNPSALGTELDNVPPPATPIVAAGQARLWTLDTADRTLIRHSKLRQRGDGVSFNEVLTIKAPQPGGNVTALEVTEGGVLIFKERAIYLAQGLGSDNLGNNPYPQPHLIAKGIGAEDSRSLVRTAVGVIFRSSKGFYLLDNAYQLQYIGAGAEDYDGDTVAEALDVPAQHQARFVVLGVGLVAYDYLIGEWSVWPSTSTGASAVWWDDSFVAFHTAAIMQQVSGQYQDAGVGYSMVIETAWIKLNGLNGFGRLYKLQLLGEEMDSGSDSHTLRVRIAYNGTDTWVDDYSLTPTTAGPLRQEVRVSSGYQKCTMFKVRIEDLAVTGDESNWKQAYRLTGLSALIGRKPGLARLPAAQRT